MILYFSFILLIVIQNIPSLINKNNKLLKQISVFLFFIELFIILGFKAYTVGIDSVNYYGTFLSISNNFAYNITIEQGYLLFNKLLSYISYNPQIIFIVTGLLISFSISYLIYKKSNIILLSIIIYLTIGCFSFNLSGLRQSIAISICILSYQFILYRKFIKFSILVFLASTFHYSAIVFYIAYPLYNLKLNKQSFLLFICFTLFTLLLSKYFINTVLYLFPKYQTYIDTTNRFDRNIIGGDIRIASIIKSGINFTILLFSLYLWNKIKSNKMLKYSNYMEFKLLLYFSLFSTMIIIASINATIFERVAMYFNVFYIILIPKTISYIEEKNIRLVYILFIVLFCILYITIISIYRPEWNVFLNYRFCWQ